MDWNQVIMTVCMAADCKHAYSHLTHWLESGLWKKDRLIDSFVSVDATQAKHISYAAFHCCPSSPIFLLSLIVSDYSATLYWLALMHNYIVLVQPWWIWQLRRVASLLNVSTAAFDLNAKTQQKVTPVLPDDPAVCTWTRAKVLLYSSTPNLANQRTQLSWKDVVFHGYEKKLVED